MGNGVLAFRYRRTLMHAGKPPARSPTAPCLCAKSLYKARFAALAGAEREFSSRAGSRRIRFPCVSAFVCRLGPPWPEDPAPGRREELEERQENGSLRAYLFGAARYFSPT